MALAPMTKLEAVNSMLSACGEAPVQTLGDESVYSADLAERIIDEVTSEIQSQGCHFNTEYNYELLLDGDGHFQIPANAVQVDACDLSVDVAVRGGKLYDLANHTDEFTQPSMKVDIIFLLDFEDCPNHVKRYIAVRATRKLQDRLQGDQAQHVYTEQDELEAKADFQSAEAETADYNILNSPDMRNMFRKR